MLKPRGFKERSDRFKSDCWLSKQTLNTMKSQENLVKLQCTKCDRFNYWTHKNKKKVDRKIELKKYCEWDREHTMHKEVKK